MKLPLTRTFDLLEKAVDVLSLKYDPDQPRAPAGSPEGGQFGSGGGGEQGEGNGPKGIDANGVVGNYDSWSQYHDGPPLSGDHKEAVEFYQGNGYMTVNGFLRKGEYQSAAIEQRVAKLDAVMKEAAPLKEMTTVFRGLGSLPEGMKAGSVFVDKAFVSTTTSDKKADWFARGPKNVPVIMRIKMPAGKRVLSMGHATKDPANDDEKEVLIPRNAKFKVEKIDYITGDKSRFEVTVKYMGSAKK